jgi:hypothetical protein
MIINRIRAKMKMIRPRVRRISMDENKNSVIKDEREYRTLQSFALVPRAQESDGYIVRGMAVVFNTPTLLYEWDEHYKYYEVIDRNAFDECDMSDVIFNYNHSGKVVARLRNNTLSLKADDAGLNMEADLSGTVAGRELFEEIDGGYIDKMSFSFSIAESKYDEQTRTRTITKIKKLYDVSAVDIPAYKETSISARSFYEVEHSKELEALEQASRRNRILARLRTYPKE